MGETRISGIFTDVDGCGPRDEHLIREEFWDDVEVVLTKISALEARMGCSSFSG